MTLTKKVILMLMALPLFAFADDKLHAKDIPVLTPKTHATQPQPADDNFDLPYIKYPGDNTDSSAKSLETSRTLLDGAKALNGMGRREGANMAAGYGQLAALTIPVPPPSFQKQLVMSQLLFVRLNLEDRLRQWNRAKSYLLNYAKMDSAKYDSVRVMLETAIQKLTRSKGGVGDITELALQDANPSPKPIKVNRDLTLKIGKTIQEVVDTLPDYRFIRPSDREAQEDKLKDQYRMGIYALNSYVENVDETLKPYFEWKDNKLKPHFIEQRVSRTGLDPRNAVATTTAKNTP